MSNLRRVLERQEREDEEISRKRAEEDRELDENEDEVVLTVGMLNQSRQYHQGRVPNVDRHRHSQDKNLLEDYFIPNSLHHISSFQGRYRMCFTNACGASADQVDEIARLGKSTILECLVRFYDAIETLYMRDYFRKPTPRDLQRLLQKLRLEVSQA
ncbi:uncharacterized protein LOC110754775 [Prunus avium]|uniref:Uncharacterized protein LOC110754775 n=1 Tax=Prunus avium TaxID=42229 RepID=A0A6P5SCK8_PRUAV|nr:uncharacterized protein LOC110754775 [Prunus avium]